MTALQCKNYIVSLKKTVGQRHMYTSVVIWIRRSGKQMSFIAKEYVNAEPNVQIELVVFNVLFIPEEINLCAWSNGTDMPRALLWSVCVCVRLHALCVRSLAQDWRQHKAD